jgi:DNA-binding FadR family transcriptional regulator
LAEQIRLRRSVVGIRRERLHDKLTREIALGVMRGDIGQGEFRLSNESDLCRHFAVSRTVLREAVKVLADKGLIELSPRTGIHVRPRNEWNLLDPDLLGWLCEAGVDELFIRDLCEVRAIVEPAAAELAASRASDQEIEELLRWYRLIEANTADEAARLEADRNFHAAIFAACHNVFLTQMNTTVGVALRATQHDPSGARVHLPQVMEESVLAHKRVADAIARRDSAAARTAMERLIKQSTEHIHRVLHPSRR